MGGWRPEALPAVLTLLELPVRFGLYERLRLIRQSELAE